MAPVLLNRPPDLSGWATTDDDTPRPPEAPLAPYPLPFGPLDSPQSRRAVRRPFVQKSRG